MSQLVICDLPFVESMQAGVSPVGGSIVPSISTSTATALDTKAITSQNISGNLTSGFNISSLAFGSAAAAAAAAASVGGNTIAIAGAKA